MSLTTTNLNLEDYEASFKVVSASTTNGAVDLTSTGSILRIYTDSGMTSLLATLSPVGTPFLYNSDGTSDYTLYLKVTDSLSANTTGSVDISVDLRVKKLECGKYQIYNPKTSGTIEYLITTLDDVELDSGEIEGLSYTEVELEDGIFKLQSNNKTIFLINFCAVEKCFIDITKQLLAKECCDLKLSLLEREKINKLLITYDLYKKLVDIPEKYIIKYSNLDMENEISKMYEATELATQILELCESCSSIKSCGCGC